MQENYKYMHKLNQMKLKPSLRALQVIWPGVRVSSSLTAYQHTGLFCAIKWQQRLTRGSTITK